MKMERSGAYFYRIVDGDRLVGGASQLSNNKWIAVDQHDIRVKGSPIMDRAIDVKNWFKRQSKE